MSTPQQKKFFRLGLITSFGAFILLALTHSCFFGFVSAPTAVFAGQFVTLLAAIMPAILISPKSMVKLPRKLLALKPPSMRDVRLAIVAEFAVLPIIALIVIAEAKFMEDSGGLPASYFAKLFNQSGITGKITLAFSALILAPLTEEIIFRRILYNFMRECLGSNTIFSCLTSASVFAFIHLELVYIAPLFVLGTAFQILAIKRKSITASLIMHSLHNAIAIFAILINIH